MQQHNVRHLDGETLGREMTLDKTTDTYVGVTNTGTRVAVRRADFEAVLPRFDPARRPGWWLYNFTEKVLNEEGDEGEWVYEVHDAEEGIYTGGSRLSRQDAYQLGNDALETPTVQFVRLYQRTLYVQTLRRPSPEDRVRVVGGLQTVKMLEERE